ncbi:hypothetical protein AGMMS49921_06670 [Endomicrobiia bacterium]|nr:hypothetical protein AGMMS49921_06670 [Endomicrobiia bacterium]
MTTQRLFAFTFLIVNSGVVVAVLVAVTAAVVVVAAVGVAVAIAVTVAVVVDGTVDIVVAAGVVIAVVVCSYCGCFHEQSDQEGHLDLD